MSDEAELRHHDTKKRETRERLSLVKRQGLEARLSVP